MTLSLLGRSRQWKHNSIFETCPADTVRWPLIFFRWCSVVIIRKQSKISQAVLSSMPIIWLAPKIMPSNPGQEGRRFCCHISNSLFSVLPLWLPQKMKEIAPPGGARCGRCFLKRKFLPLKIPSRRRHCTYFLGALSRPKTPKHAIERRSMTAICCIMFWDNSMCAG